MTTDQHKLAPRTVYYDLRGFDGERMEVLSERFAATRADIVAAAKRLQSRVWGGRHTHAGSMLIATDSRGKPRWRISPNLAVVDDITPSASGDIAATLAPSLPRTSKRAAHKRNTEGGARLEGALSGFDSFSATNHRHMPVQGWLTYPGERPDSRLGPYQANVRIGAKLPRGVMGWRAWPSLGLVMEDPVFDRRMDHATSRAIARAYAAIDKGLGVGVHTSVRKVAPKLYTIRVSIDGGPSVSIDLKGHSGSREEWQFDMRRPPSGVSRDDNRSLVAALILGIERAIRRSHTRKTALTSTNFVALADLYGRL